MKNGNYNIIFKSAKYNNVRNEIDTETMTELGTRKRKQDGDEEKTHLCIRYNAGEYRFLAVHESNHYGITLHWKEAYLPDGSCPLHRHDSNHPAYELDIHPATCKKYRRGKSVYYRNF